MSTITLCYLTLADLQRAAEFLAELTREGVVFKAVQNPETMLITFTGGF